MLGAKILIEIFGKSIFFFSRAHKTAYLVRTCSNPSKGWLLEAPTIWDVYLKRYFFEWGSGGWISWVQNSTFSGDQIFDHEGNIQFAHEVKFVH
jgi:hypothetical protein